MTTLILFNVNTYEYSPHTFDWLHAHRDIETDLWLLGGRLFIESTLLTGARSNTKWWRFDVGSVIYVCT